VSDLDNDTERRAQELRQGMVADLVAGGALVSPEWRAAFEHVPRHAFVPTYYRHTPTSHQLIDASDADEWLAGVYADELLLIRPDATSSSTVPSLMAVMLEALDPDAGDRILEVGTGSGYNAALLSHRLGDDNVTTVDIDAELADLARERLVAANYRPAVRVGDGLAGWPDDAPYDKLIATCAVEAIPPDWLAQVRPGGRIVVPLATGIAVITVEGPSSASGRFLPESAYFMLLRGADKAADAGEILGVIRASTTPTRPTDAGMDTWFDNGLQFLLAVTIPGLRYLTNDPTSGAAVFWHPDGSWAALLDGEVQQDGPRRIWNAVEHALRLWEELDHPSRDRFTITVAATQQLVKLDETAHAWDLSRTRATWPQI
jgi:protein-L-isoaspartate(D-aspartate) O-methyltransferase